MFDQLIVESTKDDKIFVKKFRLNEQQNNMDIVPNFKLNQKFPYDQAKMVTAIQNGMILLIRYKGEDDQRLHGGERTIYPMVLGKNKSTNNTLLRAWHVEGYSVKEQKNTKKVWRLFNVDNIESMTFVGDFFRLGPRGYKMNDRVMSEKTIIRADFNQIRRNQNSLIQAGKIEAQDETNINKNENVPQIKVKSLEQEFNLSDPWYMDILKDKKNQDDQVKVSILKTTMGNDYIALMGAIGKIGRTVNVWEEQKSKSYKVIDAFTGTDFYKKKNIGGKTSFKAYLWDGKK